MKHFCFNCVVEREIEARNLLENMLGFTRHERLDVKKPGPPAAPPSPLDEHNTATVPNNVQSSVRLQSSGKQIHKEYLLPKAKKIIHFNVDNTPSIADQYTFVVLKTP